MSVICSKFLVKLALTKQIFLKTRPYKYFGSIWTEELQADCSELRKQHLEYTMTLFDCNHLAHVIKFFGKCKNLCVALQFLFCFILNLRAISEYKPRLVCLGSLPRRRSYPYETGSAAAALQNDFKKRYKRAAKGLAAAVANFGCFALQWKAL